MYNITRLWKKPLTYRMVTFPNGTYGIEKKTSKEIEYLSKYGGWHTDIQYYKDSCSYENLKDAAEQMSWLRQEFPDAVIKEY